MNFKFFNNILDKFLKWTNEQPVYSKNGWQFDKEIVPLDLFVEYFTEDRNHLCQIYNKESPMRKFLNFDDIFIVKTQMTRWDENKKNVEYDEKISKMIEQVMDREMMDTMSYEQKKDYIKNAYNTIMQMEGNENKDEQEYDDKEVDCIDIFCLRILSLLVCRGRPADKATFLAELTNDSQKKSVSWNNTRLTRTLKLMLYITSILPNKFMSMNYNENVYHKIMNPDRKKFLSSKLKNK